MIRDTGSPRADAESDFLRARRHQVMSALAARFRTDGEELAAALSFDEVVKALGRRGESSLGTLVIPLDRIIGSVDKVNDFDRQFRPTSARTRARWERIAQASRRGESMPPIDVYKLGDMYFVQDGHHRVSVSRALGLDLIEAHVKEVQTSISADGVGSNLDLDRKHWRRVFLERVPLVAEARKQIKVSTPRRYGMLAEMVEAWATRRMHSEEAYMDKPTMAARWYGEEFVPVLALIDEAELRNKTETGPDAYMRIAGERYAITREHAWDENIMAMIAKSKPRRGH